MKMIRLFSRHCVMGKTKTKTEAVIEINKIYDEQIKIPEQLWENRIKENHKRKVYKWDFECSWIELKELKKKIEHHIG